MSEAEPPSLRALWSELAPHIEWPQGFGLVLLFAGHPRPVEWLRARAEHGVRERGGSLRVLNPASADEIEALVSEVFVPLEDDHGALWIELLRRAGAPAWTRAVQGVLQRLNERRFLLERDVGVPVVMVLPLELRGEVYVHAPDLWTVRSFVGVVPAPEQSVSRPSQGSIEALQPSVGAPSAAEHEWERLMSREDRRGIDPADGFFAFESARVRGDLRKTRRIAMQTLAAVLQRIEQWDEFDVSDVLARVSSAGTRFGRDLSIAVENLGRVENEAGNLSAARELFERSVRVCEGLAKAEPHSAQAQRDLLIAYNHLGTVEEAAGNLSVARELFLKDLAIAEALAKADSENAQAAFDFVLTLNALARVESDSSSARQFAMRARDVLREMNTKGQVEGYAIRERALRDLEKELGD